MGNDKTYDRHVNIWINGKEVKNDLSSIEKEMRNLRNEYKRATIGTQEWIDKGKEYKKVKKIVDDHNTSLRAQPGIFDKIKTSFSSVQGMLMVGMGAAYAAFQSFKGILEATDETSDKLAKALGGVNEAIGAVSRMMATGNFKNFFKNIREAVDEGQRFADAQDAIGDSARALALEEDKVATEILNLKLIQNDARKSNEESIAAGEEIERKMQEMADKRVAQASKNLENEMENARFKSKLDNETILGLIQQDKAYEKVFTSGKKYYDLGQEALTATTARRKEIIKEVSAMSDSDRAAYEIYKRYSNLTEADRDKIVAATKAVGEADRSAKDSIMRAITKLNTAREAEANNKKKIDEDSAKSHRDQEVKAEQENQDFIDREVKRMEDEADRKRAIEVKAEKENQDFIDREVKRMEDEADRKRAIEVKAEEENTAFIEREIRRMEDEAEEKKRIEDDLYTAKKDVMLSASEFGSVLFDRQFANLESQYKKDIAAAGDNADAKAKIDEEYNRKRNELSRKAAIAEKAASLFSIAVDTAKGAVNAASKIVTLPLVPWIIANGVLQAAIVAARPIPEFAEGGYTRAGGKYEPAGIVHAGEWVASADMVANPQTGAIIAALEQSRRNGQGFSEGGMVNGGGGSQTIGGGSGAALISTDPELKVLIRQNTLLLAALRREGVKTVWGYKDIDNVRTGMTKLEDIEGEVSL